MSTAHENTESIFQLFRVLKLDISDAIKDLFPFLEVLRDNNVISNKQYDVSEFSYILTQKKKKLQIKLHFDILNKPGWMAV